MLRDHSYDILVLLQINSNYSSIFVLLFAEVFRLGITQHSMNKKTRHHLVYLEKFQKDLNNNSPITGYRLNSKSKAIKWTLEQSLK